MYENILAVIPHALVLYSRNKLLFSEKKSAHVRKRIKLSSSGEL